MDKLLNTVPFQQEPATSTTESHVGLQGESNSFYLAAVGVDCRVRFGKPITAPAFDAYFYDATAGTYTALAAPSIGTPWTLNSMKTTDRIYIGIDGDLPSVLDVTIGNANGNASIMSARMSDLEGQHFNRLTSAQVTTPTLTDGTAAGGATLAQNGKILISNPGKVVANALTPDVMVGRVWVELRVSGALDASVTITGLTVLGEHVVLTAGTNYPFDVRADKIYFMSTTGTGSLQIQGVR